MKSEVVLTDALIEAGSEKSGGWEKAQLALLGVGWPPPQGWKRALVGRHIGLADYEEFLSLRGASRGQLRLF